MKLEKMVKAIFITAFVGILLSFIGYIAVAAFLINNPEEIGEWFRRLLGM